MFTSDSHGCRKGLFVKFNSRLEFLRQLTEYHILFSRFADFHVVKTLRAFPLLTTKLGVSPPCTKHQRPLNPVGLTVNQKHNCKLKDFPLRSNKNRSELNYGKRPIFELLCPFLSKPDLIHDHSCENEFKIFVSDNRLFLLERMGNRICL